MEDDFNTMWVVLRLNTLADELYATHEEQERIIADIQQSMHEYIKSTEQRIKELETPHVPTRNN